MIGSTCQTLGLLCAKRTHCTKRPRIPTRSTVLLRDFVHDSLYDPQHGYFTSTASIISHGRNFDSFQNFVAHVRELPDRKAYFAYLSTLFSENGWRTPSELFGPVYVNAVANYIVQKHRREKSPYVFFPFRLLKKYLCCWLLICFLFVSIALPLSKVG